MPRRLLVLLVVLAAIGVPAAALRAVCAGRSCDRSGAAGIRIPFCRLPDGLKALIAAGFREGRSPDVLAVTRRAEVWGGTEGNGAAWPAVSGGPSTAVPVVFAGTGVAPGAAVPAGTGLDAIAPTIADIIGFRRPHPEVRAGEAVPGVPSGETPRLVLEVAWRGVGSPDLRADPKAWPFLRSLMRAGAGTLDGETGSLPLDPAATLTTIGTGGPPSQHGITGTLLRDDRGELTRAWSRSAPLSVIATLADDLDQAMDQEPLIGLVATDTADRGIVGGNWYLGHDRDGMAIVRGDGPTAAVSRMLATGFGADEVPDLLAVVVGGSLPEMDGALREIVAAADRAARGSVAVIVTATGSDAAPARSVEVDASELVRQVEASVAGAEPVVAAAVPGGLFLDQATLADEGISGAVAAQALLGAAGPDGRHLMADAFQGFAVSFARYC